VPAPLPLFRTFVARSRTAKHKWYDLGWSKRWVVGKARWKGLPPRGNQVLVCTSLFLGISGNTLETESCKSLLCLLPVETP
jgi:hypothetical protein